LQEETEQLRVRFEIASRPAAYRDNLPRKPLQSQRDTRCLIPFSFAAILLEIGYCPECETNPEFFPKPR
jgi:hypothetical protein